MEWLNYHHLLYFCTVAKHGGIAPPGEHLRLRPPTLSALIRQLEGALGDKLFARDGRKLVLTEFGRLVYGYADDVFALGREMPGVRPHELRARDARHPGHPRW